MTNPSKVKGDRAELAVVKWLREFRGYRAERVKAGRAVDAGDITWPDSHWLCDVKDQKAWRVQEWMRDAEIEADWTQTEGLCNPCHPLLILKPPGVTDPGKWLAIVHLEDLEL
jgi:hypothetical protein